MEGLAVGLARLDMPILSDGVWKKILQGGRAELGEYHLGLATWLDEDGTEPLPKSAYAEPGALTTVLQNDGVRELELKPDLL
jgi:hypothetical protein